MTPETKNHNKTASETDTQRDMPTIERYADLDSGGIICKLKIPGTYIADTEYFWRVRIAYWLVRMVFGKVVKP